MSIRLTNLIPLLIFGIMFLGLFLGQSIYNNDIENNTTTDIYNLTDNIKVNFSCGDLYNQHYSELTIPQLKFKRLNNIVCSFGEFMITSGIEVSKFGVEFGYDNPQYDYDFFFTLFKLYLYAIIIVAVVPLLIPLAVIFYLIGLGLYKIFIYLTKKDKDNLDECKEVN